MGSDMDISSKESHLEGRVAAYRILDEVAAQHFRQISNQYVSQEVCDQFGRYKFNENPAKRPSPMFPAYDYRGLALLLSKEADRKRKINDPDADKVAEYAAQLYAFDKGLDTLEYESRRESPILHEIEGRVSFPTGNARVKPTLRDFTRKSIVGAGYRVGASFTLDALYLTAAGATAYYLAKKAGVGESIAHSTSGFVQNLDPWKLARVAAAVVAINFADYKWNITENLDKSVKKLGRFILGRKR